MIYRKGILSGFLFLQFIIHLYGQGQNPSSLRWQQIKTPHFTVVFPRGILDEGQRAANLLEKAYIPDNQSLHQHTAPISVYLFDQSVISNGYTTLAPRYIAFYTTPPQQALMTGGADWLQTLTVHEYRHAVQYSALDNNLISFFGGLFGDYGRLIFMDFTVPRWVFEGDAVCEETALTHDGRGRLPSFTRDYRAMAVEWKKFTYHEAFFGSYKKYFPDFYHIGYLMTSYVRRTFGDNTWYKIWNYDTKLPFSPWRFTKGIRKYTGYSFNRTFIHTMMELQHNSLENLRLIKETPVDTLYKPLSKVWTSYTYPFFTGKNSFIALKTGLDDAPKLVQISDGVEKKLLDINPMGRINSNGEKVVWSEEAADLRWGQRNYSNVVIYDLDSHEEKVLTNRQKLFAPALSPSADTIAALEYGPDMRYSMVLLSSDSGKEIARFPFPAGDIIRMPSWSADGEKLVFTRARGQKKYLSQLDLRTGKITDIHDFGYVTISNPVWFGKFVLFNSPSKGVDAIQAINTKTGNIFVVSVGKYGVYNAALSTDRSRLIFQDYSTNGYFIASSTLNISQWKNSKDVPVIVDSTVNTLAHQELSNLPDSLVKAGSIFGQDSSSVHYPVKPYRSLLHALDIHSWIPGPVNNGVEFAIISNDKLNTTSLIAGFDYFPTDRATREFADISYAGLFPVFTGDISYGNKYDYIFTGSDTLTHLYEKVLHAAVTLPFNFSRGIYTSSWSFTGGYTLANYRGSPFIPGKISALEFNTTFSNLKQRSLRDIDYRWGQEFAINYWHSLSDSKASGDRINFDATVHLPGFFDDHAISLNAGYEKSTDNFIYGVYQLTSSLEFVRGYARPLYDELRRGTAIYSLPLFYPDFSIGRVLYCKRVSSNLFYDEGITTYNDQNTVYNSAGVDLNTQLYFFSLPIGLKVGVRFSRTFANHSNEFQLLITGRAM